MSSISDKNNGLITSSLFELVKKNENATNVVVFKRPADDDIIVQFSDLGGNNVYFVQFVPFNADRHASFPFIKGWSLNASVPFSQEMDRHLSKIFPNAVRIEEPSPVGVKSLTITWRGILELALIDAAK